MVAQRLSGKEASDDVKAKLTAEIAKMKKENPGFEGPGLTIVQVAIFLLLNLLLVELALLCKVSF